MNQQVLDMQAQTIDQMKAMQTQALEMNSRMAETIMGVMPEMPAPFAEYLPDPVEMTANYFDFMGEMRDANREFMQSWIAAWTPNDKVVKAPAKSAKK